MINLAHQYAAGEISLGQYTNKLSDLIEKQKELNEIRSKYTDFQKTMLNQMIRYRDGITTTTRSASRQGIKK